MGEAAKKIQEEQMKETTTAPAETEETEGKRGRKPKAKSEAGPKQEGPMFLPIAERTFRITMTETMLGTIPANQQIFSDYVNSKAMTPEEREEEALLQSGEIDEETGLPANDHHTGFFRDSAGIYLMNYHIKGFLKEAGNILKEAAKVKALRSKIDNNVFVFPRKIYLAKTHSGVLERPLRAQTAQGPRVALAQSLTVDAGIAFNITIRLLDHKELSWSLIELLLDYGELKGLGQWRNGGYGTFSWEDITPKKK